MSKELMQRFRTDLDRMRDEVAKALPKGIDPDRFIRTVVTTVQMQPDLLEANRSSLFAACMQAAKDGLIPDGKEATIQTYNTNTARRGEPANWVKMAQYMPMVGGLISKLYSSGRIKSLDAAAVYEKDEFRFVRGDDPKITHEPYLGADEPGSVVAAYMVVKLDNGGVKREVMAKRDIEKVRAASKASDGPGWKNWYDQFAIKAVIKRGYKQLPSMPDLERLIEVDNQAMGFEFAQQDAKDIAAITGEGVKAIGMDHLSQPAEFIQNKQAEAVSQSDVDEFKYDDEPS